MSSTGKGSGRSAATMAFRRPVREQQPRSAAEHRQHHAFGQQLPDQPRALRAQREPDRHFSPTLRRAGEQQVRDVDARDQQHDPDDDHQDRRELHDEVGTLPVRIQPRVEQRNRRRAPSLVVDRKRLFEIGKDRAQVRPRLLERDARLQPSEARRGTDRGACRTSRSPAARPGASTSEPTRMVRHRGACRRSSLARRRRP